MITKANDAPPDTGTDTSEADLIARAQAGDTDAVGQLYLLHHGTVLRYVRGRTRHRQLAEDLTADVFVRAVAKIHTFTHGTTLIGWLITIARNAITDHVKRPERKRLSCVGDFRDVMGECVAGGMGRGAFHAVAVGAEAVDEAVFARLDVIALHDALSRITARQADCLRWRFLQERSVGETATELGLTYGATKTLQHRAMTALRSALQEATS
ncbi:RNA polymerase sigma factor [Streptomyces bauhiniae]|uniref:RNA polymerase sigma factor n=1 Tax=Streptomyces bauhiniae TaxID=2340725 RepID=UPI003318BBC7